MPGADKTARPADTVFLARQFVINLLVGVVMTVVMTALIFHGRAAVPLWGFGNLAFDLVPSTVMPTIGATIALTKATASAMARGLIRHGGNALYGLLPCNDALAGLAIGLGLLAVLGSGFVGIVSYLFGREPVPYSALLICKLVYVLILCLVNTPMILARAKQRSGSALGRG